MRILLAATASYDPPRGGATRSNLIWLNQLAAHGHPCRVICGPSGPGAPLERASGVELTAVEEPARRTQELRRQIAAFNPDWVLVSSEDLGHALLREAHHSAPGRVVYLAHTPQFFPFGPASWNPEPKAAEMVAASAGVAAIGSHMAEYIQRALGREAAVIHPPIYGAGPFEDLASFGSGYVAMINPCAVKGLPVFLAVARRMPAVEFAVTPGWGTTAEDLQAIAETPNVRLVPNRRKIDDLLRGARLLLMPSLWYEGFGLIVMEAMLRGIPVIASDAGGLREAKRGTGYLIPTPQIERYQPVFDEHGMPKPVAPEIHPQPWVAAVSALLSDPDAYARESHAGRARAHEFVQTLDAAAMERFLLSLGRSAVSGSPSPATIESLSSEKRALLLERLRKRQREFLMRILLAQNSLYYPAHGGGDKSNRLLMEALAARGHACAVVARIPEFGEAEALRYQAQLAARGVSAVASAPGVAAFERNGVAVEVVVNASLRATFEQRLAAFAPDVVLCSTDDPPQTLLSAALAHPTARVVFLARAGLPLPFGPDCAFPSETKTARIRQADRVVAVSEYVARYIREHGRLDAVHVPISLPEPGPWPLLGAWENEFVTMANPCAVKGISIFLALADAFPGTAFAAVPTWGATAADRAALAARTNIRLLDPVDDMDRLFARTRVLLVPSLWAEARSRIVLEAMLRGVPVMAAAVGGIPEAKLGVPYLLPVHPIARYHTRLDEQMVPVAETPAQDVEPWQQALARLLDDRPHHAEIAAASRQAALEYAARATVEPFEAVLREAVAAPKRAAIAAAAAPAPEALSPDKRRLLAVRLRQRAPAAAWFPNAQEGSGPRLFCFPWAGGGAAGFAPWRAALPGPFRVCPVQLPGRESRAPEAPFERMAALVEALASAIAPYLDQPFAFFGHSMGAGVAFELARALAQRGLPAPRLLAVSSAKAPQIRKDWTPPPDPSEEAFIAELRRLEGLPAEALHDPALLRALLPAMMADAALYRRWSWSAHPPFAFPIRAFGGEEDPNVRRSHLEAWAAETSGSFALRLFPGGHFYLRAQQAPLLEALAAELQAAL